MRLAEVEATPTPHVEEPPPEAVLRQADRIEMIDMNAPKEVLNPSKRDNLFRYDPANPPAWARDRAVTTRSPLSLEDRARLLHDQQQATPSAAGRRARSAQAKPRRSGDDQALGGSYAVVISVLCGLMLVAIFYARTHGYLPSGS